MLVMSNLWRCSEVLVPFLRHVWKIVESSFWLLNVKQTISTRKIMCTIFWDRQGVQLIEFLPQGTKINSAVYCETLEKLKRAIENKRRGKLGATNHSFASR